MGPYCQFCGRRCFVERKVPGSRVTILATCSRGAANDGRMLGVDYRTAHNALSPCEHCATVSPTKEPIMPEFSTDRPTIVCLCGSTRFRAEMSDVNRRLTLTGSIVLAPGVFAHDGDEITDEQKAQLDELHLRKIDCADEVLVVDPGGYVGESTKREIAYARAHDKAIYWLSTLQPLEEQP